MVLCGLILQWMHITGNFYCPRAAGESGMLNLVQVIFADTPGELHVEELYQWQGGRILPHKAWNREIVSRSDLEQHMSRSDSSGRSHLYQE